MKVLLLVDPVPGWGDARAQEGCMDAVCRAAAAVPEGERVEIAVCAPGDAESARARLQRANAERLLVRSSAASDRFAATVGELRAEGRKRAGGRAAYYRGEGEAAGALRELLGEIRNGAFAFDLVFSTGSGRAAEKAARALGAESARFEVWPRTAGRWRRYAFVHFRDAHGRDAREALRIEHLARAGMPGFGASIDRQIQGEQETVNPFEASFAPLQGAMAEPFRAGRKTAVVAMQDEDDPALAGGMGGHNPAGLLERTIPTLLEAGWGCVVTGGGRGETAAAQGWLERRGVFAVPFPDETASRSTRRAMLGLLSRAGAVITESSEAGLEAILLGRPVLAEGEPFYKIGGMTPTLETILHRFDADEERRRREMHLRSFLLRSYGGLLRVELAPGRLLRRIVYGAGLNRKFAAEPERWAKALHRQFASAMEKETRREIAAREAALGD